MTFFRFESIRSPLICVSVAVCLFRICNDKAVGARRPATKKVEHYEPHSNSCPSCSFLVRVCQRRSENYLIFAANEQFACFGDAQLCNLLMHYYYEL